MQGGPWYSAPIAPGVPVNTLTLAKVAGSIALTSAGCPWLAFALNSALTTVEAKDGGLSWKQAAVQIGVNAAITYATMGAGDAVTSTLGNAKSMTTELASAAARSAVSTMGSTLASGIQYHKDGSFGWDQDRMTDNKTWSQAGLNFAVSFGASAAMVGMQNQNGLKLNSNLLATTVSTTINTVGSNFSVEGDGGWDWEGFGNIDGQKAVINGASSYVSSTLTGGMRDQYMKALTAGMINAYARKGASELFERYAGRDFGDEFSINRAISVDTLSISAQNAYMDTKNRILVANMSEKEKKDLSPEQKKQLGITPDERSILRKMGDGLVDAGASLFSMGKSVVAEAKLIMSDAERIGDFGESIRNKYNYGIFASDESKEIKDIKYKLAREKFAKMLLSANDDDFIGEGRADKKTGPYAKAGKLSDQKSEKDAKEETPGFYAAVKAISRRGKEVLAEYITSRDEVGQFRDDTTKGAGNVVLRLFEEIQNNPESFVFNKELEEALSIFSERKDQLAEEKKHITSVLKNSKAGDDVTSLRKDLRIINGEMGELDTMVGSINQRKERFNQVKDFITGAWGSEKIAAETANSLCCALAFWAHGVTSFKDVRPLSQFLRQEMQMGNLGGKDGKKDTGYMSSLTSWTASRGMASILPKNDDGSRSIVSDSVIDRLNASGRKEAVVWVDKREKGSGTHYHLIIKHKDNNWYNYDNNRGGPILPFNFNRTYGLFY